MEQTMGALEGGLGIQVEGVVFPDKKEAKIDYSRITRFLQEAQAIREEASVSQETATWIPQVEYPNLPIAVVYMTDIHYGNLGVDYKLLDSHLRIVEETPNTLLLLGGDTIDNFSPSKHPIAMLGDAVTPQMQAQAFMEEIKRFDAMGKLGGICHGNHEGFIGMAGLDYYQTFMQGLKAPIFTAGGMIDLHYGDEEYKIGWNHTHWGRSKLNITNAAKRAMEFSYPGAEIVLVGHDHQAAAEMFDRAGKRRLVIDGGTYKINDPTGKQWGLGEPGRPGYTMFFWPHEHRFEMVADPETAKEMMDGIVLLDKMIRQPA